MDKQVQKTRSTEILILGTVFGAAIGAGLTVLLSKPETRKKTFKVWDEIREETMGTLVSVYKKTKKIWTTNSFKSISFD